VITRDKEFATSASSDLKEFGHRQNGKIIVAAGA
jgi:hypothetical protein